METCLRPTTMMLLTVAVMVLPAPGELILYVVPREIHLTVGSCVTLSCCAEESHRCWVEWFRSSEPSLKNAASLTKYWRGHNSSGKSTETQQQQCPQREKNEQKCTMNLGEYTILNAKQNQTGWYFCQVTVDIPVLNKSDSEGANIIFEPPDSFMPFSWWIWIILGVSCLIVVVLLITCILKKKCTTTDIEDPIYANTHPPKCQPSPRGRMLEENMKAASSYQNSHTPNFGRRNDNDKLRYQY
ncbi:uncharacterized protein LOC115418035 isoform X2 [Sphaeramia orbicularis]|uniref:uncharacterized protein LOC115418035 isoform X2 n=1 Tax=Sphaeramia orbicularis TaxID=375764 RepID=UPI00117D793F|nr:uncharacterized protein LOC115418035 isoform X2 [Sphaeramia orbicularis]